MYYLEVKIEEILIFNQDGQFRIRSRKCTNIKSKLCVFMLLINGKFLVQKEKKMKMKNSYIFL